MFLIAVIIRYQLLYYILPQKGDDKNIYFGECAFSVTVSSDSFGLIKKTSELYLKTGWPIQVQGSVLSRGDMYTPN